MTLELAMTRSGASMVVYSLVLAMLWMWQQKQGWFEARSYIVYSLALFASLLGARILTLAFYLEPQSSLAQLRLGGIEAKLFFPLFAVIFGFSFFERSDSKRALEIEDGSRRLLFQFNRVEALLISTLPVILLSPVIGLNISSTKQQWVLLIVGIGWCLVAAAFRRLQYGFLTRVEPSLMGRFDGHELLMMVFFLDIWLFQLANFNRTLLLSTLIPCGLIIVAQTILLWRSEMTLGRNKWNRLHCSLIDGLSLVVMTALLFRVSSSSNKESSGPLTLAMCLLIAVLPIIFRAFYRGESTLSSSLSKN